MRSTVERELKLGAGAEFAGIPFEGRELPEGGLPSAYFDTDDLRLAEGRITLRRRTAESREPAWQLKLPTGGDRLELEWPAPTGALRAGGRGARSRPGSSSCPPVETGSSWSGRRPRRPCPRRFATCSRRAPAEPRS